MENQCVFATMGLSTSSQVVLLGGQLPASVLDLLVVSLSTGLVGSSILDRIRGDGDSDDGGDDDDPLLGGDGALGGNGLGDDGDWGDDEDWGDDPFGGMDDGDEDAAELENRLDELETEVSTLSSTVGTVRGENEHISETVEEVEEDIRQLLDIYEMVTRGINPFVDDAAGLGGDDLDGGSFGLFEDDEEGPDEDLDPEVVGADAAGFFDEELVEPSDEDPFSAEETFGTDEPFDDEAAGDGAATGEDDATSDDDPAGEIPTEDDAMETDDSTSGKSFEELKAEYDSGDADWAGDGSDGDDDTFDDEWTDDDFDDLGDGLDDEFGSGDGSEADERFETTTETFETDPPVESPAVAANGHADPEPEPESEPKAEPEPTQTPPSTARSTADTGGRTEDTALQAGRATAGDGFQFLADDDVVDGPQRPYLEALPGGYVSDLLVMEWLEYLVEESTVTDAARAVNYYRRIGWVAEPVAADLREFLTGFGSVDLNRVNEPGCDQLTPAHHQRSLKYVMQLSGATAESLVVDRWDSLSGVGRGL